MYKVVFKYLNLYNKKYKLIKYYRVGSGNTTHYIWISLDISEIRHIGRSHHYEQLFENHLMSTTT